MPIYTLEVALIFEVDDPNAAIGFTQEFLHDIQTFAPKLSVRVRREREPHRIEIEQYHREHPESGRPDKEN